MVTWNEIYCCSLSACHDSTSAVRAVTGASSLVEAGTNSHDILGGLVNVIPRMVWSIMDQGCSSNPSPKPRPAPSSRGVGASSDRRSFLQFDSLEHLPKPLQKHDSHLSQRIQNACHSWMKIIHLLISLPFLGNLILCLAFHHDILLLPTLQSHR